MLGNLVTTGVTTRAAEASHYNAQPMINVYASVQGRDLGAVAGDVAEARRRRPAVAAARQRRS